jgi:hypothetical protein
MNNVKTDFLLARDFNENEIISTLDKVSFSEASDTTKTRGKVISTLYEGRVISTAPVSDIYYNFNFPGFSSSIVKKINNYFTPQRYSLKIHGGVQELRVYGDQFNFNGDEFFKMISILNSADRSKALQINIGLLRMICSNGAVIGVANEYQSIRCKHFTKSLTEKIEIFRNGLKNFNIVIDNQLTILNSIQNKRISFEEVVKGLAYNEEKEVTKPGEYRVKQLASMLLSSPSDKLDTLGTHNAAVRSALFYPLNYLYNKKNVDFDIDTYQLFNCYIETYKYNDAAKQKLESSRILALIN